MRGMDKKLLKLVVVIVGRCWLCAGCVSWKEKRKEFRKSDPVGKTADRRQHGRRG